MASKYLQKYPVPEGFHQILHDFAREVLRDQPDDIIKYGADYFECMTQGKEFKFESKYNIAKGEAPGRVQLIIKLTKNQIIKQIDIKFRQKRQLNKKESVHKPPKPSNMTEKAKVVVEKSNNRPDSQQVKRVGSGNPNNVSHVSSQGSFPEEKKAAKEYVHDLYDKITKDIDDIENPKNDQKDSIDQADQADQVDQMDQMDQVDQMDQMDQQDQNEPYDQQDQNFQEDQNDQPEELPKLSSFDDKDMQNIIKIQAAAKGKMVRKQVNKKTQKKSKEDLDKIEQNQKLNEDDKQLVETEKFSLGDGQQEFIQEEE